MSNPARSSSKPRKNPRKSSRRNNGEPITSGLMQMGTEMQAFPSMRVRNRLRLIPDPFPPRMFEMMTWAEQITLTSATTIGQTGTEYIFNLNDIFDFDRTGGSHQPYGFDQMANLYGRFLIWQVLIELHTTTLASNSSRSLALTLAIQPDNNTFSTGGKAYTDIMEQTDSDAVFLHTTGMAQVKRFRVVLPTILGLTNTQYYSQLDKYAGTATASPSATAFLRCALANMATTDAVSQQITVRATFRCEWFGRIVQASSN